MEMGLSVEEEAQPKPLDKVVIAQPLRKHLSWEAGESSTVVLSLARFCLQRTFGNV